MKELDVRGMSCPIPLMQTKKALEDSPREIAVLADSGTAKANVIGLLNDEGFAVTVQDVEDGWRIVGKNA